MCNPKQRKKWVCKPKEKTGVIVLAEERMRVRKPKEKDGCVNRERSISVWV